MKNTKSFFDASLAPEELEKILQSIDENIAARSALRQTTATNSMGSTPNRYTLPVPAPVPDFSTAITIIRNAQAPYYVVDGSLPRKVIKKAFNLFIKVFGRKQAYYNELTLDVLNDLVAHMNTLQQQNSSQVNVINDLVNTVAQLENSVEELYTMQGNNQKLIEPLIMALKPKTEPKRKKIVQSKH